MHEYLNQKIKLKIYLTVFIMQYNTGGNFNYSLKNSTYIQK